MSFKVNFYNNDIQLVNSDYGTETIAVSTDLVSLSSDLAYFANNKFLPLTGGKVTNTLLVSSNLGEGFIKQPTFTVIGGLCAMGSIITGEIDHSLGNQRNLAIENLGKFSASLNLGYSQGDYDFTANRGKTQIAGSNNAALNLAEILSASNRCFAINSAYAGNSDSFASGTSFAVGKRSFAVGEDSIAAGVNCVSIGKFATTGKIVRYSYAVTGGAGQWTFTLYNQAIPRQGEFIRVLFENTSFGNVLDFPEGGYFRVTSFNMSSPPYTINATYLKGSTYNGSTLGYINFLTDSGTGQGSNSVAIGQNTLSHGEDSCVLGFSVYASGARAFSTGSFNKSIGDQAYSSGLYTNAIGNNSHTEGVRTKSYRDQSHSEGNETVAYGLNSHSEGLSSLAYGDQSRAAGWGTNAFGDNSSAEGYYSAAASRNSHSEGLYSCTGKQIRCISINFAGPGFYDFLLNDADDYKYFQNYTNSDYIYGFYAPSSIAPYNYSPQKIFFKGTFSSLFYGSGIWVVRIFNPTDNNGNLLPLGSYSTQGLYIFSSKEGTGAHAEGGYNSAVGDFSHAEGYFNTVSGAYAHAEGAFNYADGINSHVEGKFNFAKGKISHSAGIYSVAAHDRTWIWKGSTVTDLVSTTRTDQFLVSAAGGVYLADKVGIRTDNIENELTVNGTISTNNPIAFKDYGGSPSDPVNVIAWLDVYVDGQLYKMPLFV